VADWAAADADATKLITAMDQLSSITRRLRFYFSKASSLLLLFQRTPIVQILLPEARLMSTGGATEIIKWTVATVAGLGAYDTVAGASTVTQLTPNFQGTTVPAAKGSPLSFTFQYGGSDTPDHFQVIGSLPDGLTQLKSHDSKTDTISGIPTGTGNSSITIKAWRNAAETSNSVAASFTINVGNSVISTQPASKTISSGTSTTLTIVASGSPLTYQWYSGTSGSTANPIAGATSASFSTPKLTNTTRYWVRVIRDSTLVANSDTAVVTVGTPPLITSNPASITINSGGTTTLAVAASGTSPTYQWYLGSSGNTNNPISGANSSTYKTPTLTSSKSYWVRASNSVGSDDSTTATVTVRIPPAITTQPVSTTINSGSTTTLTVSTTGTTPTFQWYLGNSGDTSHPIAGATTASYKTPSLTSTSRYWVKVSNAAGSINSSTATVSVIVPPSIVTPPLSMPVNDGGTVTLTVVTSGAAPSYQWYLGLSGDTSNPLSGETSAEFTTPPITGPVSYWVRVTNAAGSADSATANLTVAEVIAPTISLDPASVSINSGNTTTLTASATGTGPFFQWYIGNSGDTTNLIAGATDSSYTTPSLSSGKSYWVKAFNSAGSANSATAVVSVISPPAITSHPASVTINSGKTATLAVSHSGSASTFQWYMGSKGDLTHPIAGATSSSYITPPLTTTTRYWVKASNSAGSASSNAATVTVIIAPAITKQPASRTIAKGKSAVLSVEVSGSPSKFQWYIGNSGVTTQPISGATSSSFTTPALTSTTKYWVKATNSAGSSSSSNATVTVQTPPAIKTQPGSIRINKGSSTTLTVKATGSALTYQWYLGVSGNITSPIPHATAASFKTPALKASKQYWVRVKNSVGSAKSKTATVFVSGAARSPASKSLQQTTGTFEDWQAANFTAAQLLDPEVSGLNADPDGDLIRNEMEYIYGLSPFSSNPRPSPISGPDGSSIEFHTIAAKGAGYTGKTRHYALEVRDRADDPWTPVGGYSDIIGKGQTVSCNGHAAGARYRLKVWLAP
jgi:hypothetical protein